MSFKVHINGVERDCTPEEEVEIIEQHRVAALQRENQIKQDTREKRNLLLSESDWTQVTDAPVDQAVWAVYRQALRDIPQQDGFPLNVVWPEKPEV